MNNIPEIDRRPNLSVDEFQQNYLLPRRPVVIPDALAGQPIMSWTYDLFRQRYGEMNVRVIAYRPGFTDPHMKELPLRTFLDWCEHDTWREHWPADYPPPYLERWMAFDPKWGTRNADIANDFVLPPHFKDHSRVLPKWLRIGIVTQMFIGPKGTIAWMHEDGYGVHSWAVNVLGTKYWLFYAPDQAPNMYELDGRSRVDAFNPDYEAFPKFRDAKPTVQLTQRPGEVIFVPTGWRHQVRSLGPSLTITGTFTDRTSTGKYVAEVAKMVPRTVRRWFKPTPWAAAYR